GDGGFGLALRSERDGPALALGDRLRPHGARSLRDRPPWLRPHPAGPALGPGPLDHLALREGGPHGDARRAPGSDVLAGRLQLSLGAPRSALGTRPGSGARTDLADQGPFGPALARLAFGVQPLGTRKPPLALRLAMGRLRPGRAHR